MIWNNQETEALNTLNKTLIGSIASRHVRTDCATPASLEYSRDLHEHLIIAQRCLQD
jgi:hypothetical protein